MKKVLIANRGEIAVRVARACATWGIESVAVYVSEDADAMHVALADEAVKLPETDKRTAYLDPELLIQAALTAGADAVHPGYGFLSESADFARRAVDAGLVFIGPQPETLALLGDKVTARAAAIATEVPVIPGSDALTDPVPQVLKFGAKYGWPVLVKAAAGGGGRGMRVVDSAARAPELVQGAGREATAAFGDGQLFVEKYLEGARHIEVQVAGDVDGNVVAIGDRDCSVQRRHQKLIEEAPAPHLSPQTREAIAADAVRLCRATGYVGIGTVEFLVHHSGHYFLEVNGRVQVEHPVTEQVTGVDLVVEQLRIAAGLPLSIERTPEPRGHAIEIRINAEDPGRGFAPQPGRIGLFDVPHCGGVRFDTGFRSGDLISASFDSLIGKLVVHAPDREQAIRKTLRFMPEIRITGPVTTLSSAAAVLQDADFARGGVSTGWFEQCVEPTLLPEETEPAETSDISPPGNDLVVVAGREVLIPTRTRASRTPSLRMARPGGISRRDAVTQGDGRVISPMSGTVLTVHVEPGDRVDRDAPLVTLEAMKMENTLRAPSGGVVDEVLVVPGTLVNANSLLVTLRPDPETDA
ncbi:acetyl-CoA carboxylase, biotin carboxylase [Rhodococcus opacus PD630]|uniref:acetyl/propionyl/methylcrotonyl-CoA carboxylase subunit alpha n=1 Tax=Rhodococcus opacus TaxID=37919 RepID=UPI00029CCDB8|nr:biotin carboxylase N-terminal domain-containing protein [Rhodococcus opacus]AHK36178.1 Acetyl-/propionyl-coenzyme A carboxylase alpha chain [Rhodococcus opacus PD630]EHI43658.1 acetyl-CoA carboxylase, biotin carboxylase [Rhodococcus opacus PD630]UDH01220.1 ATP-grasp domain-containing protein [Rhodococcus opacus PD630]